MPVNGNSTKTDVRERLIALLLAHGLEQDAINQRALNRATDTMHHAFGEAFEMGVTEGFRVYQARHDLG